MSVGASALLPLVVELPIRIVSESNAHEHWRPRQRRAKAQRTTVHTLLRQRLFGMSLPVRVELVRIAPRELDTDNLQGAFKHVRDGVADALGVNDRDKRVAWTYEQRKGRPKQYGISIAVIALGGEA